MEAKSETAITIINTNTTAITPDNKKNKKNVDHGLPKKKRGGMQVFKVALYMLRNKSGSKSKSVQVDVASKGMWKKLLGSMRPLHLQSNQSPPQCIEDVPMHEPKIELIDEVFTPPMSPSVANEASSSSAASSVDSMSRYASAVNLQDLDRDSDEEDNGYADDNGGDHMIDAKAEEFIARFYEQMRLQTLGYNRKFLL